MKGRHGLRQAPAASRYSKRNVAVILQGAPTGQCNTTDIDSHVAPTDGYEIYPRHAHLARMPRIGGQATTTHCVLLYNCKNPLSGGSQVPKLSRKLYFAMLSVLLLCVVLAGCNVFSGSSQSGAAHSAAAGTTAARLPVAVQAAAATPAVLAPQPAGAPAAGATAQGGTAPAVEATSEVNTAAPTPGDAISTTVPLSSTVDPDTAALLAQDTIPARDLRSLAMRLKPNAGDIPVVVNATPPNFKVGDQQRFWVGNEDTQEHRQITATLKYVTPHVYMWVENGVNVDQAGLEKSADRFETKTYPTDRQFFGSEWTPGVDNDVHLRSVTCDQPGRHHRRRILWRRRVLAPRQPVFQREGDVLHLHRSGSRQRRERTFYDGVLAHEFQHMIHWAHDRNEESWVNEGMSMLAAHLNGFDVGGLDQTYSAYPAPSSIPGPIPRRAILRALWRFLPVHGLFPGPLWPGADAGRRGRPANMASPASTTPSPRPADRSASTTSLPTGSWPTTSTSLRPSQRAATVTPTSPRTSPPGRQELPVLSGAEPGTGPSVCRRLLST